jgi:cell division transport system permease protein
MTPAAVVFLLEEAAKNIRRNGMMSLAALSTVAVAMSVLGGSVWSLYRLHQFADAQPKRFEMQVFLKPELDRDTAVAVMDRLRALPDVAEARLFPKERAWQELQNQDRDRGQAISQALAGENPLPDRIDLRLGDPAATRTVSTSLRDRVAWPEIDQILDAQADLEKLMAAGRLVRNVAGTAAVLLLIATALVIQNTIRLTVLARRREIRIMQLVGATSAFIRLPMVLEGLFYGLIGALIGGGAVLLAARQLTLYGGRLVSPLAQGLPAPASPALVLALMAVTGGMVGCLGSMLSLHRFLARA